MAGPDSSSPHQRGNTPAGSEDPSWLPSPPSQACGSQRPSTRSLAQPSSTANASKRTAAEKHRVRSYGRRKGVEKTFCQDPLRSASRAAFQKTDAAQRSWVKTRTDLEPLIRTSLPPNQQEDLNSLRKLTFLTKSQYGMICERILDILCIYMYISNCIFGNTFHIVK